MPAWTWRSITRMKATQSLRIFVHIAGVTPALVLAWLFFTGGLGINPIQYLQQKTGVIALIFLLISLACTPAAKLIGWKVMLPRRQALGVYGFLYAASHFLVFIGLDYGFDISLIWQDVRSKSYILIGFLALLLLTPLAITSLAWFKKRMGSRWKKLHRLAYVIPIFVLWHFFSSVKGNLATLQGNLGQPLLFSGLLIILLMVRLPVVQRRILAWSGNKP